MEDFKTFNDKLLVDFECVVCTEYMHPPIVQCIKGHSVCVDCHNKLGKCPTCRQEFDVMCRPQVLERLHSRLIFPCKFHEQGCEEHRYGLEIKNHEECCKYRPEPRKDSAITDLSCQEVFNMPTSTTEDGQVYRYLSLLEALAGLAEDGF